MANITNELSNIKNAVLGKDVRSSIHDGIYAINKEVESTTQKQSDLNDKQDALNETFKNLVINAGTSNAEVAASRGSYDYLPDRLNGFDEQFNTIESFYYLIDVDRKESIKDKFKTGEKITQDNRILKYNSFMNYYDKLLDNNSEYVSRQTLGNDASNTYPIYKYKFKPYAAKFKILVVSGVHGQEYVMPHTLYNFLELLCNKEVYKYPYLQELRENVEFTVIPIANPYGWDNYTRYNANNVDINRNFDWKWSASSDANKGTSAFSEVESQYIRDVMNNDNFDFIIDLHNTHDLEQDFYSTFNSAHNNSYVIKQIIKMLEQRKIAQYGNCKGVNLIDASGNPTLQAYGNMVKNISTFTIEWVNSCYNTSSTTWYGEKDMTESLLLLVNVLYRQLQHININSKKDGEIIQIAQSATGAIYIENQANFTKIEAFNRTFTAEEDCVVTFTGAVTIRNEGTTGIVNVLSLLNTTGTITKNEDLTNELYIDYIGRTTIPLFSTWSFKKGETINLSLFMKAGTSKASVWRYRGILNIEYNKTLKKVGNFPS